MKTDEERGLYGRWLVAAREARGLKTADKARAALATAGIRIGQNTYAEYESGTKRPSRNHLPLLEGFWGPPDALEVTETPEALVSALQAQTAAIERLVMELAQGRADQQAATETLLRAVASLVPARAGKPAGSGRDARAGIGR